MNNINIEFKRKMMGIFSLSLRYGFSSELYAFTQQNPDFLEGMHLLFKAIEMLSSNGINKVERGLEPSVFDI